MDVKCKVRVWDIATEGEGEQARRSAQGERRIMYKIKGSEKHLEGFFVRGVEAQGEGFSRRHHGVA